MKPHKAYGSAIKALDDGGLRVGGYLVRFTNKNDRDLTGEFFDKDTDFWIDKGWPVKGERALLEHGLEDFAKVIPIGLIDMVKEDEFGIYVEAKLNDRADYEKMLREMRSRRAIDLDDSAIAQKAELAVRAIKAIVETGKIGWSSGALPQGVVIGENGHIDSWPIIEGSLTFTPAEPDSTDITPLKSAFDQLQEFMKTQTAHPSKEAQPIENEADTPATSVTKSNSLKQGTKNTMEILEKIAAMIQEYLAAQGGGEAMASADASAVMEELKAEMPEEEVAKAMEDEELAEKVAEKALQLADARLVKRQKSNSAIDRAYEARLKKLEREAEPVKGYPAGGAPSAFSGKRPRVQVGDNLKYAHLGADDMALGLVTMMAQARTSGVPVSLKTFVDAGAISEEFIQTFKGKIQDFAKTEPYGKTSEGIKRNSVIKSFAQKANEIDGTLNTGFGAEWVGEFWSTTLWGKERFPLVYDRMVQKGMWTEELGQGVDTGYFPIEGADPTAYRAPQAIDLDATNRPQVTAKITPFATGYVSVTPGEIKIATSYTRIFDEDSLIRLAPQVNKQLTDKALETRDQLLINGDTETGANTNINRIDGTPTSTGLTQDYYLTSNGFRKLALVTAPAASVTSARSAGGLLTDNDYLATRKLFSAELRPYLRDNALFIIDPDTYESSLAFASVKTDDVNKTGATVREGELLKMWGVDIFNSGFLPESNTAGKVSTTPGNNIYGSILGVFAKHWGVAYKRQIMIDTDFDILSGSYVYVLSMRIGVVARGTKASVISYYVGN